MKRKAGSERHISPFLQVTLMQLKRLKGIANDALRQFMLTPARMTNPLFQFGKINENITVDLLTGKIDPPRKGDDVEDYYRNLSSWFKDALLKEGIPIAIIDKAVIVITTDGAQICTITANGKMFESSRHAQDCR